MTALCGGGASASKAGVAATIIFTAGSLSSLLNNKGGYWATLAAPLLGVLAYQATDLCTVDPPAQPTISAVEYESLLQLGPWDTLQVALSKLADIVTRVVWFDMCECTSVTTPPLPTTTLDPPSGVTIPNYGGSGICPQPRARLNLPLVTVFPPAEFVNVTRVLFPGFPIYRSVANANAVEQDIIAIPNNWTSIFECVDAVTMGTCTTSFGYGVSVLLFGPTKLVLSSPPNVVVSPTSPHECSGLTAPDTENHPYVIDHSTAKYLAVQAYHESHCTGDAVVDYSLKINCSGTATTGIDCCADPAVIALLTQLMQQVNLIQRQQVPFAYNHGTVHAGLTGSGSITVQGLIGALVELTTVSTVVGEEIGVPTQTFEAGWVSWGNSDGFSHREFITNESFVSLPSAAGQYVLFSYNLPVGVVATITELVREQ